MKKGKKCFENISSLAAEATRGFAEGFGVLISCTFTSCAMHCAVKLQLCSWCHGSRLLCSDPAFACTSSSRFSCSTGKTTSALAAYTATPLLSHKGRGWNFSTSLVSKNTEQTNLGRENLLVSNWASFQWREVAENVFMCPMISLLVNSLITLARHKHSETGCYSSLVQDYFPQLRSGLSVILEFAMSKMTSPRS